MTPLDLLKINVNDKTEKKNGMTYLSWAWAWTEVLKADSAATFEVKMWPDGTGVGVTPLLDLGGTGMVWVTVTMFGKPMTCQLPVLDYRNKPIASPDAMAVNTAIMRCLVKAIALHGLGLYIYSGEDTPDEVVDTKTVTVKTATATAELEVPVAKAADQIKTADQMDAETAKLFADGMLEYISVHRDLPDLNSYWKKNQTNLDKLKVSHPDLYATVRNGFAEFKKTLQSKEQSSE